MIRIGACGICASDCKCWSGAAMFWDGADPWVKAPVVPGHEFVGHVEELGDGAAEHFGVTLGDHVIAEQIVPCERCRYCRSGQYWMCEVHNIFGFQRTVAEGGMAQYMRIPGQRARAQHSRRRCRWTMRRSSSRWRAPFTRSTAATSSSTTWR